MDLNPEEVIVASVRFEGSFCTWADLFVPGSGCYIHSFSVFTRDDDDGGERLLPSNSVDVTNDAECGRSKGYPRLVYYYFLG